jgi:hypothetical protein
MDEPCRYLMTNRFKIAATMITPSNSPIVKVVAGRMG